MIKAVSCCAQSLAMLKLSRGMVSTIQTAGMLLALVLGLMASASAVQPTQPAAAERQFQAWLVAFNEGSRAALQEFQQKNKVDQTDHVADDLRFREMTGGFELKNTEERTPTKLVALLKEKNSDTFARATLEVETAEPHRVVSLQISATMPPAEFRIRPMAERDAIAALKTFADKTFASDRFSGAVAISKPTFCAPSMMPRVMVGTASRAS